MDFCRAIHTARKPRADGQRNRQHLVDAAKAAFAELGADVALGEIARRAGLGIGTFYRHFPTRDAIVEAVYRQEVQQLAAAATSLLATHAPGDALHAWMQLFVDYIATKKVIAAALGALAGGAELYASSGALITEAIFRLVGQASRAGDIGADTDPDDVLRALVGFTYGNTSPAWQTSARRLVDILMAGLRQSGRP